MITNLRLIAFVSASLACSAGASAQGLIWSIPDAEGRWIRYEGNYTQIISRPNDPTGDLTLTWTRHMTIKALETQEAMYGGRMVPCRWIEFKVITGPVKEGIIDAGPGGVRLYKILVPVEAVRQVQVAQDGSVVDADLVLATHVPIVQGYRKIGNESAAPMQSSVFQIFPTLSLVQHYREIAVVGMEDVSLLDQTIPTTHIKGELVTEDPFTRSTGIADIWRTDSDLMPFGVAKWQATITVESKDSTQPRDQFVRLSEVSEEMSAAEVGDAAESELVLE
jgi:hypothetical protein